MEDDDQNNYDQDHDLFQDCYDDDDLIEENIGNNQEDGLQQQHQSKFEQLKDYTLVKDQCDFIENEYSEEGYEDDGIKKDDDSGEPAENSCMSQVDNNQSSIQIVTAHNNHSARKQKRIIITDDQASRRRSQVEEAGAGQAAYIIPNKGSESRTNKKNKQQELANGGLIMKPQNTHQQSKTSKIDDDTLQKKKIHQKSARLIQLPRATQPSQIQDSTDLTGDSLFDSLFENLSQNLLNYSTEKQIEKSPIIDQNYIMLEYTQRLRQEAMNKYANQEQQIRQNYQDTMTEIQIKKNLIECKKQSLESLIQVQTAKAQIMIDSFDSQITSKYRDFSNPLLDQSWRLAQNWIFSLLTDTEKCVRYSRIKAAKHVQHVQKEKVKYQDSRIHHVFTITSQTVKQLPFVKLSQPKNLLQPLNTHVLDMLIRSFNLPHSCFEHIGTLRNKPYLKLPKSSALTYRISLDHQRFPSISTLLQSCQSLSQANQELLHLTPSKIQLKNLSLTASQLDQTITNDVLLPFQEPSLSSKRELRVFVCAKQSGREIGKKIVDEVSAFKELMKGQGSTDKLKISECTIKRLKNTNQLKVQVEGQSEYSILNECRLRDLVNSNVFQQYFQTQENPELEQQQSNQIDDFFIIEENSFFNLDPFKIVSSQRKLQHFRKLSAFEVSLLIFKSFGHLLSSPQSFHFVELKLQLESLRKLTNSDPDTSLASINSPLESNSRYLIVDCYHQNDKLVKQYLIKCNNTNEQLQKEQEPNYCMYPNCLQCVKQNINQTDGNTHRGNQAHVVPNNVVQKKPRPESAGNRNVNSNNGMVTSRATKRLARLSMVLEMEISESPLLKILGKKFKLTTGIAPQQQILNKDKSAKNIISNVGQQATLIVNNTIEQQQQFSNNPRQTSYQVKRESFITAQTTTSLNFCTYHQQLERFITQKLNISLQPIYLRPNSFHKAIKSNFSNWRDEIKGSLAFDLFLPKSSLKDILNKIFSVCLSSNQMSGIVPDASQYTEYVFTQQPQVINVLENYYNWIANAQKRARGIYCKSQLFSEARKHFYTQIQAFNMNLHQAKDNESFLGAELKRWLSSSHYLSAFSHPGNPILFQQLQDIVRSKDVIFKFQQFQALADRLNSGLLVDINTTIQQQQQQQQNTGQQQPMLPKIQHESMHYQSSGQNTNKHPNNQTHTQGFFPRQESFNSNKAVDKLTQIYGSGSSQIGNVANISGHNFNPSKKVQPQVADSLRSIAGIYEIQSSSQGGSNLKQQPLVNHLLPIQRKFSAGNKRTDNPLPLSNNINVIDQSMQTRQDTIVPPPLQTNIVGSGESVMHYFSYSGTTTNNQGASAAIVKFQGYPEQSLMESPHSSKTFKNKNDILQPLANSSQGTVLMQKQRAISANKYNQQSSLNSGNSIQNNNEYYNGTSSGLIQGGVNVMVPQRPGTNTSLNDKNGQLMQQRQTSSQMRNQKMFAQQEIHAQALTVAQTFQQPPPKFPQVPPQMFGLQTPYLPQHSLIPIQAKAIPPRHTGGAPSNLLGNNQKLKQVDRQQIIVNTYSQPQNVPIKTSIGFHPQTGAQLIMQQKPNPPMNISINTLASQVQPRVASAHQEKDKQRLVIVDKQPKKSKKKGSHSNATRVSGNQQLADHQTVVQNEQQQFM